MSSESIQTHHLETKRTARYCTLGLPETAREVWLVLHGYGQLAEYFLRSFRTLDDGRHLIVAPEGLSRFYLDGTDGRVGASWMTSADRRSEIDDYVDYLDAVLDRLRAEGMRDAADLHVLGFSQGTATACRWAAMGNGEVDRLVLWAGGVPPDLDLNAHRALFQRLDLTLVIGTDDEYISDERVAREEQRLKQYGIPFRTVRFEGTHRIEPGVLTRLID